MDERGRMTDAECSTLADMLHALSEAVRSLPDKRAYARKSQEGVEIMQALQQSYDMLENLEAKTTWAMIAAQERELIAEAAAIPRAADREARTRNRELRAQCSERQHRLSSIMVDRVEAAFGPRVADPEQRSIAQLRAELSQLRLRHQQEQARLDSHLEALPEGWRCAEAIRFVARESASCLQQGEEDMQTCLRGVGCTLGLFGDPHALAAASAVERADAIGVVTSAFPRDHMPHAVREHLQCVVCTAQPRDCVFLPCGHSAVCMGCANAICAHAQQAQPHVQSRGSCPICRAAIDNVHRVRFS